jgi:hypothetical protein
MVTSLGTSAGSRQTYAGQSPWQSSPTSHARWQLRSLRQGAKRAWQHPAFVLPQLCYHMAAVLHDWLQIAPGTSSVRALLVSPALQRLLLLHH